ncbi:3-deoxy-7-phosphoheptulonate synthase [Sphingomonas sp. BN140010]|uniref:3-deoxy-7-phosphoheptulonate synthase n=1 Tax=Sphingomonas arvum TaxID=2992113 RepID=A0ABT3JGS5_9SPHN|nr:3-deoxy-7-phosphoheptulonate synthase [Sphingomonas sp. BN140010]MCW3798292.1 3-deoxy-7-phosphoheptulonate synthase [Sphingomonas sp. BN140010]
MIIVLKPDAPADSADRLLERISSAGLKPLHMPGSERVVLGALGDERVLAELALDGDPAVESVKPILAPYKLVSRELHPHDTVVDIGGVPVGGERLAVIAGPCAVEDRDQLYDSALAAKQAGATLLRAGAYKPRTSPYGFSGHGPAGLSILREVADELGMPVVTEVMDTADLSVVAEQADALQIGARNMQNFALLRAVGQTRRPVVLKRGLSATIQEWLLAAEYLLSAGNDQVVLCERGIRTFETATRNTLDLNAVPYVKGRTHLPIIVDPSHGTGLRELVPAMALAGVAAGADGLMIEVHRDPAKALSDGAQSLYPDQFADLMRRLEPLAAAVGRSL